VNYEEKKKSVKEDKKTVQLGVNQKRVKYIYSLLTLRLPFK
jgi:hypothetical protein